MSSEESNKISSQMPSQGSPSEQQRDLYDEVTTYYNNKEDEWLDKLYNEIIESVNDLEDDENFFDIWDKNYARRQLARRLELESEEASSEND